jgi:hypothetical protein
MAIMDEEDRELLKWIADMGPGFWFDERATRTRPRLDKLISLGLVKLDLDSPYHSGEKPFYCLTDLGRAEVQQSS